MKPAGEGIVLQREDAHGHQGLAVGFIHYVLVSRLCSCTSCVLLVLCVVSVYMSRVCS